MSGCGKIHGRPVRRHRRRSKYIPSGGYPSRRRNQQAGRLPDYDRRSFGSFFWFDKADYILYNGNSGFQLIMAKSQLSSGLKFPTEMIFCYNYLEYRQNVERGKSYDKNI